MNLTVIGVDDIGIILDECQEILKCKECRKHARNILKLFD